MKIRFFAVMMLLLIALLADFPAAVDMEKPVGSLAVLYGKPEIDGMIDTAEYACHATLDSHNMKALTQISYNVPETHTIELYFSWDNDNLYVAYDVTDPTFTPSETNGGSAWLFNGDNIQLFVDFGTSLAYRELTDTEKLHGRRAPLFATGINDDGGHFYLHQLVPQEAILNLSPDAPASMGGETENGWCAEFAIPWLMLISDMNEKTGLDIVSEENVGNGAKVNCYVIYNDYETAGTVKNMFATSLTGYEDPFDWQPEIFGINLTLAGGEKTAKEVEISENDPRYKKDSEMPSESKAPDNTDADTTAADDTGSGSKKIGTEDFVLIGAAAGALIAAVATVIKIRKPKK